MSDIEEAEYEVESVVAAKVEAASRSKRSKLIWKYLVRWKGYSADDDTWEPIESFNGSEHLVEAFWNRCTTHGRDTGDMSLFTAGEEFRPVGPPRHKPKSKLAGIDSAQIIRSSEESPNQAKAPDVTPMTTRKRRRESSDILEITDKATKRTKENTTHTPHSSASLSKVSTTRSTRSKDVITSISIPSTSAKQARFRKPSPSEIVSDSDEEQNDILRMPFISPKHPIQQAASLKAKEKAKRQESPIIIEDDSPPRVAKANAPQPVEDDSRRIPAHRERLAKPRVKLVNDPSSLSMANVSKKTRAAGRATAKAPSTAPTQPSPTRMTRSRPGPGRSSTGLVQQKHVSSLLTAEKGSLKTIKGKYGKSSTAPEASMQSGAVDLMDVDADMESPPSAEELLRLAGLSTKAAETLSDFEEDDTDTNAGNAMKPAEQIETKDEMPAILEKKDEQQQLRKESLDQAKHNLFPDPRPSMPATFGLNWGRSTIFGPLALGPDPDPDQSTTSRLLLNLDTSMAIPTLIVEASQSVRTFFNTKVDNAQVPGKFYGTEAALSLLATVRATGQSATIVVADNATGEEKKHFGHFLRRLEDGEIFVSMAGVQMVVFSSSSSTLLSSRLNTPATLLNQPGKVLVSHVDVENPSGFADAAANADPRRWIQYLVNIDK